jgi:hypothetical protein
MRFTRDVPRCLLLALALALGACGPKSKGHATTPVHHTHAAPAHHAAKAPTARATLRAYLDATLAGRHGAAWKLLSAHDQKQTSRAEYIEQWKSADRMRRQLEHLHGTDYDIAYCSEHGDRARASVMMTTALGTERTGFALKREDGHWRIVYTESWRTSK